jgi:hypothetical protein
LHIATHVVPQLFTHVVSDVALHMPVQAASKRRGEQLAVHPPLTSILHEMPDVKSKLPHGVLPPPSAARASVAKATIIAKPKAPSCHFAHLERPIMAPPLSR